MIAAEAMVPTHHGAFRFVVHPSEDVALVRGDVAGDDVLVCIHRECPTGEIFGSLACDCRANLERALAAIAERERGVLVYLRRSSESDVADAILADLGVRSAQRIDDDERHP